MFNVGEGIFWLKGMKKCIRLKNDYIWGGGIKSKWRNGVILLIASFCILYPCVVLLLDSGFFSYTCLRNPYNCSMVIELIIWFVIALLGIKWGRFSWLVGIAVIFSYLHQMLLPMVLAFIYFVLTYLTGHFCYHCIYRGEVEDEQFLLSFFMGMVTLTVSYAIMSVLGVGNIINLQIYDAIILLVLAIWYFISHKELTLKCEYKDRLLHKDYVKLVVIVVFVFLAIGRANLSLDYDSVWYGLRSPFVLDNETGIYDNLGLIGCVYSYPKGYETYMLPLSNLPSYGFMYAGNIMLVLMILYVTYKICRFYLVRGQALWGAVLVAAIPGIMNMSITAKPDILTLFIQLLGIYFAIQYFNFKKGLYLGMVWATYFYAQTLKTTSVIFSTSILAAIIFVSIVYKLRWRLNRDGIILIGISVLDLIVIWARTWMITGIPATSIWGKLFRIMGMENKYPYNVSQIDQFRAGELFSQEVLRATLTRMKEFFFAPNSGDTDHIIIAWGTTLCTFLVLLVFIGALVRVKHFLKSKYSIYGSFMGILFVGELFGCICGLWMLKKPDGNYFMLFYCVTVIVAVIYIYCKLLPDRVFNKRVVEIIFCLFMPVNVIFTGSVTWAWVYTFSEIELVNNGYFDHYEQFEKAMNDLGCVEIYNTISSTPSNKVFAIGPHPDVERIPCIIESELDINFWGNAELMKDEKSFLKFCDYEDYDYILIYPEYLQCESPLYKNISSLIKEGNVDSIKYENGFILLSVESEEFKRNEILQEFQSYYKAGYNLENAHDKMNIFDDGWVSSNASLKIATTESGKILIEIWNPMWERYPDGIISIYLDGELIESLESQEMITTVLTVPSCTQVKLDFVSDFGEIPANGDKRELSYIITKLCAVE